MISEVHVQPKALEGNAPFGTVQENSLDQPNVIHNSSGRITRPTSEPEGIYHAAGSWN